MTSSTTVTLFFALFATAAACQWGLSSCAGQCYDSKQQSCVTDQYNRKSVLCTLNYAACNGACFSPSLYTCVNGKTQAKTPPAPPAPKSSTSSTVPKPSTTSTVPKPSTSSTVPKPSTSSTVLKPTTSSTVASTSSAVPKPSTSSTVPQPTKSSTVAQPTTSSTVAQPTTSSTIPQPTTSSTFAQPTTSSTQAPVTSSSPSSSCDSTGCGSGLCNCNGACYTPGEYNCNFDLVQTSQKVLCWGSFAACNGNCFDTTLQSCVNGVLQNVAQANPTTSASPTPSTTAAPVVNPTPAPGQPYPTQTADLRIINSCKSTLWFEGRYGGAGAPIPGQSTTAVQALPGAYIDYTVPDTGLAGSRFWAKYGCDAYGKNCAIGDQMQYWPNPPGGCPANGCTPPVDSLFEATWGCRPGTGCNAQNPTTWFDTSQVDGWTIPYKLTPNGDTSGCDCIGSQCGFKGVDASTLDLAKCPQTENLVAGGQTTANVLGTTVNLNSVDLRIIKNNQVLGCMSPCKRLNWGVPFGLAQPESSGATMWMCCPTPTPDDCSPANGCISPNTCRAGPIENTQFVEAVHTMAPGVYSYSYDDGVGLHACPAGVTTYTMEFCPAGSAEYPLQL